MSLLNNLTLDDINKYFMNSVDTKNIHEILKVLAHVCHY